MFINEVKRDVHKTISNLTIRRLQKNLLTLKTNGAGRMIIFNPDHPGIVCRSAGCLLKSTLRKLMWQDINCSNDKFFILQS